MKFTTEVVSTRFQINDAYELLERNRFEIPEGFDEDARQTGPDSLNFYVMGQKTRVVDDEEPQEITAFLSHLVPYDPASAFGPVKIEFIYAERNYGMFFTLDDLKDLGPLSHYLKGTLQVCAERTLPVVLDYEQTLCLAGKERKGASVITAQSEVDEARAFLERNGYKIPEGMANDVWQTGPGSLNFYIMARDDDGGILGVAKIDPPGVGGEPAGLVKITNVYMDKGCETPAVKRRFLEDVLRVCANRMVSGVLLRIEDMVCLSA